MPSILLTPPVIEPVALDEARAFLRVEHYDDDDLIAALIAGARLHVETRTRRILITQTWRVSLDVWPRDGRVAVLQTPLQGVSAARIYDENGVAQTVDPQAFVADAAASVLAFVPWALPAPGRTAAGIEIDFICGYGDSALDVPEPLRQAVRELIAHWYEIRGASSAAVPGAVTALLAPYRAVTL